MRSYWGFKHFDDAKPKNRRRRDYLRRLFAALTEGDAVVTLNWDTTVERTLAEEGCWNPLTGYGFDKELYVRRSDYEDSRPLPADVPRACPIRVLKLHGSFGWHYNNSGDLYFDRTYFLQHFDFHWSQRPLPLVDPKERPFGPPESPVLAYPSFLKQLRGPELQAIWFAAQEAISRAERIDVWGYSLPESDSAVRALVNPLRFRLERRQASVTIHDPSRDTQMRWQQFLGTGVDVDDQRLG